MMERGSDGESDARSGELVPAPASVREWAEQLVAQAREDGVALTGEGGLLTDLMRHVLQTGLEVEMAEHLGYGPHERAGRGSGNSRNGGYDKTVVTEIGEIGLRVPRDRAGTFEPVTVPKYQRRLDGLSGNVISLYAKGLTTGDIQQHLFEIYGRRCRGRRSRRSPIRSSRRWSSGRTGLWIRSMRCC
jgi:putative transposase